MQHELLSFLSLPAQQQRDMVQRGILTLHPYSPHWQDFYATHNRAWVEKFFKMEPIDVATLGDPKTHVLSKGGRIYIAMLDNTHPIGGFSLIPEHDGAQLELSKMYIPEALQGLGLGNRLLEAAITEATALGAQTLYLMSNTLLTPAIHLYRKHGFTETPLTPEKQALYERVNIVMQRPLRPTTAKHEAA